MSRFYSLERRLTIEVVIIVVLKIAILYLIYLLCFAHPFKINEKIVTQHLFSDVQLNKKGT